MQRRRGRWARRQQQQAAHPAAQGQRGALEQQRGGSRWEEGVVILTASCKQVRCPCAAMSDTNSHKLPSIKPYAAHLGQQVVQQAGLPPRLVQPQVKCRAVVQRAGAVSRARPDLEAGPGALRESIKKFGCLGRPHAAGRGCPRMPQQERPHNKLTVWQRQCGALAQRGIAS